ncbi:MAG: arylsulfatase [Saprospiraceae bacterium]|nr:arylsulfatase [Saprospiraceae bacterium]
MNLLNNLFFILLCCGLPQLLLAQNRQKSETKPNIIYILLDDVGFSDLAPYGSEISTPNISFLATEAIRYNHFETRAICSPTRAALLTGRNNQSVGMMDLARGGQANAPAHSLGFITPKAATIAQILKEQGYLTSAVGKWHLTPTAEQDDSCKSRANWPSGKGFQNFYGWLSGWTDQYNPAGRGREMMEGDHPATEFNPGGNHVSEAIVDRAIEYLGRGFTESPGTPQFLYLAFGAAHAPIQVPQRYIQRYAGRYEKGWDQLREERFIRQKQMGIIPINAVLTPPHEDDPLWDNLSPIEKTVYARFMATYAGYIEHTDEQIGRLLHFLQDVDQYENSIIVLMSDNGAAPEAGIDGNFTHPYGKDIDVEEMLIRLEDLGTERSSALYQRPWARVGGTPFKKYKLWPFGGGVRDPLIISWPDQIKDKGGIRTQFTDVIDISPTLLDIIGITEPKEQSGTEQMPMHGSSIYMTFDDPVAQTRNIQFYCMRGNRSIYRDGWKAVAIHQNGTDFKEDIWELYHIAQDFSEAINVADRFPDLLTDLKKLWWTEAEKFGSLPLVEFHF